MRGWWNKMDLSTYKPKSVGDFEILIDRFVLSQKKIVPKDKNYSKEEHFKEILVEVFKMGIACGQMPCNKPIDLKGICNAVQR